MANLFLFVFLLFAFFYDNVIAIYIYIYIYHMRHWHALSHLLHFVRHEGRLATIGRTRVTRSMARAAN